MLNRIIMVYILGMMMVLPALADSNQNQNVNIGINPDTAQSVGSAKTARDVRLSKLRTTADKDAAKAASTTGKSYVSVGPDPNAEYWKQKNTGSTVTSYSGSASANNFATKQQIQDQSILLKKMLLQKQKAQSSFAAVNFSASKATTAKTAVKGGALEQTAVALPGTMWYSTMISGADSYVPGPVFAQIQEGPFAGGTAIGKFEVAPDGTHVILLFSNITAHNRTYSVSAVALAPGTKIPGLTGDIDHHIFTRFIIPAAANFLTEVTAALKQQESSVVVGQSGIVITHPKLSNEQLALMGASGAAKSFADATKPTGVLRLPEVKIKPGQGFAFAILKPIQ